MQEPGLEWLAGGGPHADLVVSTRIRLARNVAGRAFWGRNTPADRERVVQAVQAAAEDAGGLKGGVWHRLDTLARPGRLWLHERQIGRAHV